jgi:hypothetical protein
MKKYEVFEKIEVDDFSNVINIRGENVDADVVISNIRICIMRLSRLGIHICAVIAIIKYGYYPLSAYKVMH